MSWHQCPSTYTSNARSLTVFCVRREAHEGDHRGHRKQWNDQGELVPITTDETGNFPRKERLRR